MRFGVFCANFGFLGEPAVLVDLGTRAEKRGWDGFFVYDHIAPVVGRATRSTDPWTALAAIAAQTTTIKLGPMITPVARRQPWELAHQAIALDRLSEGRLIIGVGLGDRSDHRAVSGDLTPRQLGDRLDEGLDVVSRLLKGELVDHDGSWHIRQLGLKPGPYKGFIPMWIGGSYGARRPLRRAAQADGYFPIPRPWDPSRPATEEGLRASIDAVRQERQIPGAIDIVTAGVSPPDPTGAADAARPYEQLGATWWLETLEPCRGELGDLQERIDAGPPPLA